jgi:hypothetical protein
MRNDFFFLWTPWEKPVCQVICSRHTYEESSHLVATDTWLRFL